MKLTNDDVLRKQINKSINGKTPSKSSVKMIKQKIPKDLWQNSNFQLPPKRISDYFSKNYPKSPPNNAGLNDKESKKYSKNKILSDNSKIIKSNYSPFPTSRGLLQSKKPKLLNRTLRKKIRKKYEKTPPVPSFSVNFKKEKVTNKILSQFNQKKQQSIREKLPPNINFNDINNINSNSPSNKIPKIKIPKNQHY